MELHHSKHHQTYITNLNVALKSQAEAFQISDITSQVALQQAIKFSAGGHINHSLFWRNLAPAGSAEAQSSAAPELLKQIRAVWGEKEKFIEEFNAALLGIQGSGWGWLIKIEIGKQQRLAIVTTKDQDPVVGKGEVPLIGIDMWEHGYYLQASLREHNPPLSCFCVNILSIKTIKLHMSRIYGTSLTGRLLRNASLEPARMHSRTLWHIFRP